MLVTQPSCGDVIITCKVKSGHDGLQSAKFGSSNQFTTKDITG